MFVVENLENTKNKSRVPQPSRDKHSLNVWDIPSRVFSWLHGHHHGKPFVPSLGYVSRRGSAGSNGAHIAKTFGVESSDALVKF